MSSYLVLVCLVLCFCWVGYADGQFLYPNSSLTIPTASDLAYAPFQDYTPGVNETYFIQYIPAFKVPSGETWHVEAIQLPIQTGTYSPATITVKILPDSSFSPPANGISVVGALFNQSYSTTSLNHTAFSITPYTFNLYNVTGINTTLAAGRYWLYILTPASSQNAPSQLAAVTTSTGEHAAWCGSGYPTTGGVCSYLNRTAGSPLPVLSGTTTIVRDQWNIYASSPQVIFTLLGYKIGSCCINQTCSLLSDSLCLNSNGTYLGDTDECTPNPNICVIPTTTTTSTTTGTSTSTTTGASTTTGNATTTGASTTTGNPTTTGASTTSSSEITGSPSSSNGSILYSWMNFF